jgi:FKBP-type peptidyl-prolyl cis-trans isomerase SlyD
MVVAQNKVVLIHYTLKDDAGNVIDSSSGREPLAYIHGQEPKNLIAGLENALEGKGAGEKLSVTIAPAEGYGEYDAGKVQRVPKRQFGGVKNLQPGMQFQARTSSGEVNVITVKSIQGDMVTIDGNHELAGKNLNFDVEITEVRDATEEELSHGHVHGPGGHHHH